MKQESNNAHLNFYLAVERINGRTVDIFESADLALENKMATYKVVVTCEAEAKTILEEHFILKTFHADHTCSAFTIEAKRIELLQ